MGDSGPASIVVTAERNVLKAVERALTTHPEFFRVIASTTQGAQAVSLVRSFGSGRRRRRPRDARHLRRARCSRAAGPGAPDRGCRDRGAQGRPHGRRGHARRPAAVHLTRRDTRQPARVRAAVYVAGDGGRMVAPDGVPSLILAIGRSGVPEKSSSPRRALTPREREVLALMADGGTNRQIAARLEISEQSVKSHISNLLRKLGARNRTEAAAVARRDGVILEGVEAHPLPRLRPARRRAAAPWRCPRRPAGCPARRPGTRSR